MDGFEIELKDALRKIKSFLQGSEDLLKECYLNLESLVSAREQALYSISPISREIFVEGTGIKLRDLFFSAYKLCKFIREKRLPLKEAIAILCSSSDQQLLEMVDSIIYVLQNINLFMKGVLEIYKTGYFNARDILPSSKLRRKVYTKLDELERIYEETKSRIDAIERGF